MNTKRTALFVLLAAGFATGLHASSVSPVFEVTPPGFGEPGETVGWGFSLTNTSNFLVVTGSEFRTTSPLGTYEDFISTDNFIVVGPSPESTTVAQAFDPVALTGVGAFHILPNAPTPAAITGTLEVDYSLFSEDPNDPNFDPGSVVVADANFTVLTSVQVVPEPGLWFPLAAFALAGFGVHRRRIVR